MKVISDTEYDKRLKIAMKAFESGCVIFSNDTGKTYTPREFINSDEKVVYTRKGLEDYHNFTTLYADHAIKRKLEDLQKAEKEFQEFMVRMLNAFKLSPRQKNK